MIVIDVWKDDKPVRSEYVNDGDIAGMERIVRQIQTEDPDVEIVIGKLNYDRLRQGKR